MLLLITGYMFDQHQLTAGTLTLCWSVVFFYAVGTGIGGIIGPQLFGRLIPTGKTSDVFVALVIGSVLMIIGGIAEIVFGVKAERKRLEGIAKPLTAIETKVRDVAAGGKAGRTQPAVS